MKWLSLEELPEERIERERMRRQAIGQALYRQGFAYWFVPTIAFFALAGALLAGFRMHREGRLGLRPTAQVGHVVHAYGTVKKTAGSYVNTAGPWWSNPRESWNRLESGKPILAPLRKGDLVQTGEESSAEILFFGGNRLRLDAGTVALFDADRDQVTLRLVMGRAEMELVDRTIDGRKLVFRDVEGRLRPIPDEKRVVLTINAAEALGATGVVSLKITDELAYHDPRSKPLIVEPIEDHGRLPPQQRAAAHNIRSPRPVFPTNEADIDIEMQEGISFSWLPVISGKDDPVVAYEIIVRPAPGGYEIDDTARKTRIFSEKLAKFPIEKVDGGGTFLWSVRAVTASGDRGPASAPRWLEIKFPLRLRAPNVLEPTVK